MMKRRKREYSSKKEGRRMEEARENTERSRARRKQGEQKWRKDT